MSNTKAKAQGNWQTIITRFGADAACLDGKHKSCPACGGTNRFRFDDKDGSGSHICNQCGAGDGFELVKKMGCYADFKTAAKAIDDLMGWSGQPLSDADKAAYKQKAENLRIERMNAEKEAHRIAAIESLAIWTGACIADESHAYLKTKGVKAYGIKQHNERLVVPVRIGGDISSLQYIDADGGKVFAAGGNVSGGYCSIRGEGWGSKARIVVCEGYATGASIREATGKSVAIAFNAGNLHKVARSLRNKLPDAQIIIAADNDQKNEVNAGFEAAIKAAELVGGMIALPAVKKGFNVDWNDVHAEHGLESMARAFNEAIKEPSQPQNEQQSIVDEWGEPDLFNVVKYPPLPCAEDMPPTLWDIVEYAAKQAATNAAFSFTIGLSVIAGVIRGRGYVARSDGSIKNLLTVYTMNAALSGEGKSATRGIIEQPLDNIRDSLDKLHLEKHADWLMENGVAGKYIQNLEKTLVKDARKMTVIEKTEHREALNTINNPPKSGLAIYSQATPEAFIEKGASHGFIILATDEGSSIVEGFGRYTNSSGADMSPFLKGFDGGMDNVARRNDNSYGGEIKACLDLSVQPSVLMRVVGDAEMRSRGFVNRFVMMVTPTTAGTLDYHKRSVRNNHTEEEWDAAINRIHEQISELDEGVDFILKLSNEADVMHSNYANQYQERVGIEGDLHHMKDLFSKRFPSYVMRFAGLYHMIEGWSVSTLISANTMAYAIKTGECVAAHYIAIVNGAGTAESNLAKRLLQKILSNGKNEITVKHVLKNNWCNFQKAEDIKTVFVTLVKMGYLREQTATYGGVGRKPAPSFLVHPMAEYFLQYEEEP